MPSNPESLSALPDAELSARRVMLGGVIQDIEAQLREAATKVPLDATSADNLAFMMRGWRVSLRRVKRDLARVKMEQARRGKLRTSSKLLARDIVAELLDATAGMKFKDARLQSVLEKARQWQSTPTPAEVS